jgi:hypothetical protein
MQASSRLDYSRVSTVLANICISKSSGNILQLVAGPLDIIYAEAGCATTGEDPTTPVSWCLYQAKMGHKYRRYSTILSAKSSGNYLSGICHH